MNKPLIVILVWLLASLQYCLAQPKQIIRNGTLFTIFTSNDIFNGPYKDLNTLLSTLPGINGLGDYADRPQIRGSDFREMQVIMNGMILTDQITHAPFLNIPLEIIDTLQVNTGGFGVEYGNARAGIIKIITKQGGDKFRFQANVRYSPPALKHFGPMAYGKDSPVVTPFVKESAGAFMGNEVFEGWNSYASNTLAPGDPHYGKPYEAYALYLWRHRSRENLNTLRQIVDQGLVDVDLNEVTDEDVIFEYGIKPDWQGEFNLSGPVPYFPKAKFFLSHKQERNAYAIKMTRDYSDRNSFLAINLPVFNQIKARFTLSYTDEIGVGGTEGPEVQDIIAKNEFLPFTGLKWIWAPYSITPGQQNRLFAGLNMDWKISSRTNAHFSLQHHLAEFKMLMDYRDTLPTGYDSFHYRTHLLEGRLGSEKEANEKAALYQNWKNWRNYAKIRIGDIWYDECPNNYEPSRWTDAGGNIPVAYATARKNDSMTRTYTVYSTLEHQLDYSNQLLGGAELNHDRMLMNYEKAAHAIYHELATQKNHWRGRFFVQHAYKKGPLNARTGLLLNWLYQDKNVLVNNDVSDKEFGPYSVYMLGTIMETHPLYNVKLESKLKATLNPRLHISYAPQSFFSLYFNYGHYNQWPGNYELYSEYRHHYNGGRLVYFGNTALENPLTKSLEFGLKVSSERYWLQNTIYRKQSSNEIVDATYTFIQSPASSYSKPQNMKNRQITGLDIWAGFVINKWSNVDFNMDLHNETSSFTGFNETYEDPDIPNILTLNKQKTDFRPKITGSFTFKTPKCFGPALYGCNPLENIQCHYHYVWQKGESIQWQGKELYWRPYQMSKLRIQKHMTLFSKDVSLYLDVYNLFNNKNMVHPTRYNYDNNGDISGTARSMAWNGNRYDYDEFITYMNSLNIDKGDRPGDYPHDGKKEYIHMPGFTPWTFLEKRDIFVGIHLTL